MDLTVVGAPTSAGAHHAGQDLAPAALRALGLVQRLRGAGADVVDAGDVAGEVFRPDPSAAGGRNVDAVVRVAGRVAHAVQAVAAAGRIPVVVGGDCTITVGVVAGLQRVHGAAPGSVRVAYLDGDADLRPPHRGGSGILDATGVSHLLGVARTPLSTLGPRTPALADADIALLGYDPDDPDAMDHEVLAAHGDLVRFDHHALRDDPAGVARRALAALGDAPLVVHFDVDAIDSADLPLANFPHYTTGITVEAAQDVLGVLLAAPALAAVVLTEVNPTHDPGGDQLRRYLDLLAAGFAAGAAAVAAVPPEA